MNKVRRVEPWVARVVRDPITVVVQGVLTSVHLMTVPSVVSGSNNNGWAELSYPQTSNPRDESRAGLVL